MDATFTSNVDLYVYLPRKFAYMVNDGSDGEDPRSFCGRIVSAERHQLINIDCEVFPRSEVDSVFYNRREISHFKLT